MIINNEEQIEEDINPNVAEADAYLYQVPISGGFPIKYALESDKRPFTPPF
jgi:hypothetical protein